MEYVLHNDTNEVHIKVDPQQIYIYQRRIFINTKDYDI
jgi:hypothetical protein